ncbi:hypothetical protein ABZ917_41480 [Nonomuraea wenchangensis]
MRSNDHDEGGPRAQVTEQAARQATVAPLHDFLTQRGEFVAIHRRPSLAARLAALEEQVAQSRDRQQVSSVLAEIRQLTDHTRRDAADE